MYLNVAFSFSFQGRTLNGHDYVFWCGDFNYRVDLPNEEVKTLLKNNDIAAVLQADQLIAQQQAGEVCKTIYAGPIFILDFYHKISYRSSEISLRAISTFIQHINMIYTRMIMILVKNVEFLPGLTEFFLDVDKQLFKLMIQHGILVKFYTMEEQN